MKAILVALIWCLPFVAMAQNTTDSDRIAALQAEAAAKAQAAQEAAKAAQEAAKAAQEAAEAAAKAIANEQNRIAEAQERDAKARAEAEATAAAEAARVAEESSNSNWVKPVEEKTPVKTETEIKRIEKEESDKEIAPYLSADAVPLVDGKVQWTIDINVPGKTAKELYEKTIEIFTAMTKEENQLERSQVALLNEKEYKVVGTFQEWLVFTSSVLSLDRTQFNYVLLAECSNNNVRLTLERISYNYPTQTGVINYQAEKWITDKYSLNKKRTRLLPISGKFRRKTIDRKDQIFNNIEQALKK